MTAGDSTIVHRAGTYRTRTAEQTWDRVSPMLPLFAITRVADIGRLDEIGFPVHVAYRPTGKTLSVSVGTGLTVTQSRVSAVMESIESWHAENPCLEVVTRAPARDLPLHYDVRRLNLPPGSPLGPSLVVDWVAGTGLVSGAPCLVPFGMVPLTSVSPSPFAIAVFRTTSNGLASGNSPAEATLHALLEAIERDCLAADAATDDARRILLDLRTVRDPGTRRILDALAAVDIRVRVHDITNDLGVPCYHAVIWGADVPAYFGGYGCHLDSTIALGRALLEAAQSRLVAVSGARDDMDMDVYRAMATTREPSDDPGERPQTAVRRPPAAPPDGIEEAVELCTRQIMGRTGVEPFVVDLTRPDIGIAVSKVFAPGLEMVGERDMGKLRW